MPDLTPPELTPPDTHSHPDRPVDSSNAADPLSGLHKMSTTAGLGTTEYVAINAPAVFALILGLASVLAIVDNILLVVPIAGIVCAIVAMKQISNSNGTQTGRGLAIIGLLLSLGFGGYVVVNQLTEASRTRADREQIAKLVEAFGRDLIAGNYQAAYAKFSPRFASRVPLEQFERTMATRREFPVYGKLDGVTAASIFDFQSDPASGVRLGAVRVNFKYANLDQPAQEDAVFRKVDGEWRIENLPTLFPSQQQQQQ
jgi:hypothetical protein